MLKGKATEEEDNILPFVKPDGRGPKDDNWLKELPLGAVFLAKPKASAGFLITEFCRGSDLDEEVILMVEFHATGQSVQYFVDSLAFSKTMRLIKVREIADEDSIS